MLRRNLSADVAGGPRRQQCSRMLAFLAFIIVATITSAAHRAGFAIVVVRRAHGSGTEHAAASAATTLATGKGAEPHSNDCTCHAFQSSQLHGVISQKRAADIVRRLVSSKKNADAGTCPVFFRNYKSAQYTSWTPWQLADTLNRWSRHLACQTSEFCDDMYPTNETAAIAQLIYDRQHPRDCSRAKFLIIDREWHAGFGSTVHIKAYSLLIALLTNRVLIDSPDIQWTMTFAASCESQDWACYFAPLTNCTLPKDWRSKVKPLQNFKAQTNDQFIASAAQMQLGSDVPGIGSVRLDDFGSSTSFKSKPASWWMTQATGYVARPNRRTLQAVCYIWDCIMGPTTRKKLQEQQPPLRPFAAMFIRRGDKWWESRLREPFEYFDLLEGLDRNLTDPIKTVYVGTDDPKLLSQVAREYSQDWDMTWMGYHRSSQGSQHHEEVGRYHTAKMELQVLLTLAEVFISASADVLVGTLSSNQCRLMDELRKLQGKGRMPYLTPEGQLIAGQR